MMRSLERFQWELQTTQEVHAPILRPSRWDADTAPLRAPKEVRRPAENVNDR